MTEKILAGLVQELKGVAATQKIQGTDIKELTKAFSSMSVHNEQLRSTQSQVTALWEKFDQSCGPDGVISKIRDHQAHCPKEELDVFKVDIVEKHNRIWSTIGLLAIIYATTLAVVVSTVAKWVGP